ncbi:hypothetical protein LH704_11775 [Burkholderia cenocepacia]|uniref:hypothetical protein n=1 Tax=Burkholderia cenocepacia TaxID=95486 RepID=UPI001F1C043A|nr:hypothetical protein [Burkholderia cenocepacia]MCF1367335.1 hypothetical protein [Burkholderia cenocepacia]MCF1384868.1 hypothetical protein [Burkholderia cenocepacia]
MIDDRVPTGTLKWLGDSLLCDGDPALFQLMHADGRIEIMTLRECLSVAHRIDPYGLSRIVSVLMRASDHCGLHVVDAAAWDAFRRADAKSQVDAS